MAALPAVETYLDSHEATEAPVILLATETVVDVSGKVSLWVLLIDKCDGSLGTHIPTTAHTEDGEAKGREQ